MSVKQRGFSLPETLIAMAISSVLLLGRPGSSRWKMSSGSESTPSRSICSAPDTAAAAVTGRRCISQRAVIACW